MSTDIRVTRLTRAEFSLLTPTLVDLYLRAMHYPPTIRERRIAAWRSDTAQPRFTGYIAVEGPSVVGVAYGFEGNPSTWWHRQLAAGLPRAAASLPPDLLDDYIELAEIHVDPRRHGLGYGRALLDAFLSDAVGKYVLLSTPEVPGADNAAFRLYRSADFTDIARDYKFGGDDRNFAIFAKRLPAR